MNGYHTNIEKLTTDNHNFRKVLYTGPYSQLVVMSLLPGQEIGEEVHEENDQFFRVERGSGVCEIDDKEYKLVSGDAVVIPAGAEHNIKNTSKTERLSIYLIYSPAKHADGLMKRTKEKAEAEDEDFDGVTTE